MTQQPKLGTFTNSQMSPLHYIAVLQVRFLACKQYLSQTFAHTSLSNLETVQLAMQHCSCNLNGMYGCGTKQSCCVLCLAG